MKKLTRGDAIGNAVYYVAAKFMQVKPEIIAIRAFLEGINYLDDDDSGSDWQDRVFDSPEAKKKAIEEYKKKMYGEHRRS